MRVIAEREANGPLHRISTEFCRRVDHDKINRRALEAMIKAGAMERLRRSRAEP